MAEDRAATPSELASANSLATNTPSQSSSYRQLSSSATAADASQAGNQTFDLRVLIDYLSRLLPIILSATRDQIDSSPIFTSSDSIDRLSRFGTDSNCRAIYLYKTREQAVNSNTNNNLNPTSNLNQNPSSSTDQDATFSFFYTVKFEMDYHSNIVATLVFIKRAPTLDCSRPLDHQLHLLNLFGPASNQVGLTTNSSNPDDGRPENSKENVKSSTISSTQSNPYEELHNLVHLAVAPFFDAYVNSKIKSKNLSDGLINQSGNQLSGPNASSSNPSANSTGTANLSGANSNNNNSGSKSNSKIGRAHV